tara:strand:+ start:1022 stop:1213 length:192 start_codon:yes stop_codon:yes gene_type:complete
MSHVKNYMFTVADYAISNGIPATMEKFFETEDNVKVCILFADSYDGTWEDYIKQTNWEEPKLH